MTTRRHFLKSSANTAMLIAMGSACSKTQESSFTNIDNFDAVETATRIKKGDITALEAVNAAITRAEKLNPAINAIVTQTFDKAREDAKTSSDGTFAGVPTFVKDLIEVTDIPTGFGSRAYGEYVSQKQFPFIDDFQNTGLISIGKSTTPEFGLTATTEPLSSGITRNPWNPNYSAGGSSGGAAALVASGIVPIAHASDGGGSIRIPASCCGTVGLKVSRDRFNPPRDESTTPIRISVMGVESRSVRDTAAFLAAMEIENPVSPLNRIGLVSAPSKMRLKIGIIEQTPQNYPVHADVKQVLANTASLCQTLGHEVVPIEQNIDPVFGDHFLLYWAAIADSVVSSWEALSGKAASDTEFEPFTLGLREHFRANKAKMNETVISLIGFNQTYRRLFGENDLILSPVLASPPVEIGWLGPDLPYATALDRLTRYAQFTAPANVSGTPSISLPLGMSATGLPIGMMFSGKLGAERLLLELAFELEEAAPWSPRKPQIFAG